MDTVKASLGVRITSVIFKIVGIFLFLTGLIGFTEPEKGVAVGITVCGLLFFFSGTLALKGNIRMKLKQIEYNEKMVKDKANQLAEEERRQRIQQRRIEQEEEHIRIENEKRQQILNAYPAFKNEIEKNEPAINMPLDLLVYLLGEPEMQKKETTTKKEKVTAFYGAYQTRTGSVKYEIQITLENGIVTGIKEL